MLDVQSLTMQFGGLIAVQEVDVQVGKDEIIGLIGPNGAGKTTLFNCITGIYKPSSGHVVFEDGGHKYNIGHAKPYQIVQWGMVRTFQNVRLFQEMTVLENILVGYHHRMNYGLVQVILRGKEFLDQERLAISKSYELLEYFGLEKRANVLVKELPFGRQKVLEIVRALVSEPKLLLLDEPAAGLNSNETDALIELIRKIQTDFNLSILLIEHDMKFVMTLCKAVYVLDHGELIASDIPENIKKNPQVITAYLGEAES